VSEATYIIGDVFDVMATLPDNSFDMVMTSPPFLALRSYLPADHPDKGKEIGSEPNPAEFLDTLLALTAEWDRLLTPHGSIVVELGDTYSGSSQGGGDFIEGSGDRTYTRGVAPDLSTKRKGAGWPLPKSLCGIPHLYHLSLAYGRNLLTGEPSPAGQWRVRNVVAWCRPNPPVGALGDKFRPATSYLTIATKSATRYFDLDAVRTPHKADPATYTGNGYTKGNPSGEDEDNAMPGNPAGAPPLDWWEIPTAPYKGSHYAVYPPALLERPIKSMCPMHVCTTCGEPRRRITASYSIVDGERATGSNPMNYGHPATDGRYERSGGTYARGCETLGWTDCGHETWRTGHVLDPFGGSGTTGAVATGLGRDATLIDIDERNALLAADRIGMFLTTRTAEPNHPGA
jgi:site-specific DNA-methyltransferase (adenine-specific)